MQSNMIILQDVPQNWPTFLPKGNFWWKNEFILISNLGYLLSLCYFNPSTDFVILSHLQANACVNCKGINLHATNICNCNNLCGQKWRRFCFFSPFAKYSRTWFWKKGTAWRVMHTYEKAPSAFGQNRIMVKAALVKKVQNFLPYKVQPMNYKSEGLWSRNT